MELGKLLQGLSQFDFFRETNFVEQFVRPRTRERNSAEFALHQRFTKHRA
jgi:hypothetical protein